MLALRNFIAPALTLCLLLGSPSVHSSVVNYFGQVITDQEITNGNLLNMLDSDPVTAMPCQALSMTMLDVGNNSINLASAVDAPFFPFNYRVIGLISPDSIALSFVRGYTGPGGIGKLFEDSEAGFTLAQLVQALTDRDAATLQAFCCAGDSHGGIGSPAAKYGAQSDLVYFSPGQIGRLGGSANFNFVAEPGTAALVGISLLVLLVRSSEGRNTN